MDKDGKPTSGRGCWQPGELRTLRNITANQSEWALKTNSNRKQLKNFKSCEFQPIPLRKNHEDDAVLFQLPPDPLHVNYLGCGNDALECMEKSFPEVMGAQLGGKLGPASSWGPGLRLVTGNSGIQMSEPLATWSVGELVVPVSPIEILSHVL